MSSCSVASRTLTAAFSILLRLYAQRAMNKQQAWQFVSAEMPDHDCRPFTKLWGIQMGFAWKTAMVPIRSRWLLGEILSPCTMTSPDFPVR